MVPAARAITMKNRAKSTCYSSMTGVHRSRSTQSREHHMNRSHSRSPYLGDGTDSSRTILEILTFIKTPAPLVFCRRACAAPGIKQSPAKIFRHGRHEFRNRTDFTLLQVLFETKPKMVFQFKFVTATNTVRSEDRPGWSHLQESSTRLPFAPLLVDSAHKPTLFRVVTHFTKFDIYC